MQKLTEQGRQRINDLAQHYRVSTDAVMALLQALVNGNGTMAQFSHPELGGSGQWLQGGMTMVGDMFDHGLKAKVDGLCTELSQILGQQPFVPSPRSSQSQSPGGQQQQQQGGSGGPGMVGGGPAVSLFVPAAREFRQLVAGGPGFPERDRFPEQHSLRLLRQLAAAGRGDPWARDRLRHARPPDRRRLAAAGGRSLAHLRQSIRDRPCRELARRLHRWRSPERPGTASDASRAVPRRAGSGNGYICKDRAVGRIGCKGILSQEEFNAKKSELLSRL